MASPLGAVPCPRGCCPALSGGDIEFACAAQFNSRNRRWPRFCRAPRAPRKRLPGSSWFQEGRRIAGLLHAISNQRRCWTRHFQLRTVIRDFATSNHQSTRTNRSAGAGGNPPRAAQLAPDARGAHGRRRIGCCAAVMFTCTQELHSRWLCCFVCTIIFCRSR